MEMWSLKAYYARESWFLGLVVVAIPLLAYAVGLWVWRGFGANPAGLGSRNEADAFVGSWSAGASESILRSTVHAGEPAAAK